MKSWSDNTKEIIATLDKAGVHSISLNDLAKLLPENPEWAKYCKKKRAKRKNK